MSIDIIKILTGKSAEVCIYCEKEKCIAEEANDLVGYIAECYKHICYPDICIPNFLYPERRSTLEDVRNEWKKRLDKIAWNRLYGKPDAFNLGMMVDEEKYLKEMIEESYRTPQCVFDKAAYKRHEIDFEKIATFNKMFQKPGFDRGFINIGKPIYVDSYKGSPKRPK